MMFIECLVGFGDTEEVFRGDNCISYLSLRNRPSQDLTMCRYP